MATVTTSDPPPEQLAEIKARWEKLREEKHAAARAGWIVPGGDPVSDISPRNVPRPALCPVEAPAPPAAPAPAPATVEDPGAAAPLHPGAPKCPKCGRAMRVYSRGGKRCMSCDNPRWRDRSGGPAPSAPPLTPGGPSSLALRIREEALAAVAAPSVAKSTPDEPRRIARKAPSSPALPSAAPGAASGSTPGSCGAPAAFQGPPDWSGTEGLCESIERKARECLERLTRLEEFLGRIVGNL